MFSSALITRTHTLISETIRQIPKLIRYRARGFALPFIATLTLTACGGGSSDDSSSVSVNLKMAYFIDSGVAGLDYRSTRFQGQTDGNGGFNYQPGETTTFSYKGLTLGQVQPSDNAFVFTPLDLFNTDDVNQQAVKNTLVLLQSLDADQDPDNGIDLESNAANIGDLSSLDIRAGDFQSQLDQALPDQITLRNESDAIAHFEENLVQLQATPSLTGQWLLRDARYGDLSAHYQFDTAGTLTVTEYDNCANGSNFWTATVASALRNCTPVQMSLNWSINGRTLTMSNNSLQDSCQLLRVTPFTVEANCNFTGSGLGDELVRFERRFSSLSSDLIAEQYREISLGDQSFTQLTLQKNSTQSGSYQYYAENGSAGSSVGDQGNFTWSLISGSSSQISYSGTDNGSTAFSGSFTLLDHLQGALQVNSSADGSSAQGMLIPDFKAGLAENFIRQVVYGVYDAVGGQCKQIYIIDTDQTRLRKEASIAGSDNCQYASPVTLPQDGDSGLFSLSRNNGAFIIEQNSTQQVCWPLYFSALSENSGYLTLACSGNSDNAFALEIWRPL